MKRRHHSRVHPVHSSSLAMVCTGIFCGFFLGVWMQQFIAPNHGLSFTDQRADPMGQQLFHNSQALVKNLSVMPTELLGSGRPKGSVKQLVLIGVMTAKKYLHTRVLAAYNTWVSTIPGQVIFYSCVGTESEAPQNVSVVGLDCIDEAYPPQKKSFLMLKHMHDHYLDKFEFFMRADDDVYIRGDRLSDFLHSVNSSKNLFIGQAGQGKKEELGLLNLEGEENFCMGGPGMVLSSSTLTKIVPHIGYCLKNLYSTHEDVEVGRCVHKFAGISCTWAFEMQRLFLNNYKEPNGSFSHSLKTKEVHHAITLHPVKNHTYQYRLHHYFLVQKVKDLRQNTLNLHREIHSVNDVLKDRDEFYSPNRLGLPPSLLKSVPKSHDDVLSWDFFTTYLFSLKSINPRHGLELSLRKGLEDVVMQTMAMINKNARQRGRTIDFQKILYGYYRVNPLHGPEYILDLLLVYRKHKGKRRMTVPVRRHAYLQQTFTAPEVTEVTVDEVLPHAGISQPAVDVSDNKPALIKFLAKGIGHLYGAKLQHTVRSVGSDQKSQSPEVIHFLLPLAGRFQTFLQFMHNFEEVCLQHSDKVVLTIMLYRSEHEDHIADTIDFIQSLQHKYPIHDLRVIQMNGYFSRGVALVEGSKLYPDSALLFFIDVDIYMRRDVLYRIRHNVRQHEQVYYPIVFSQYDPSMTCADTDCTEGNNSPFNFHTNRGYWRQFGFGIAAMYKSDLMSVGGFDTSIQGWGKEDVDLHARFLAKNITVFRSVDPGLVHIFHPVTCDPSLDSAQYQMCLGSKAATFGSTSMLAEYVYKTPEILYKNEHQPEADADQDDVAVNEDNGHDDDDTNNNETDQNNNNGINLDHLV